MRAPSIIREDSFVTAMPSSLLEDTVTISRPMIMPCNVPASDRHRIAPADKGGEMKHRQQNCRDRKRRQGREDDAGNIIPVSPQRCRRQIPVNMIVPLFQHHHGGDKAEHGRGQGDKEKIKQAVVRGQNCLGACQANQAAFCQGNMAIPARSGANPATSSILSCRMSFSIWRKLSRMALINEHLPHLSTVSRHMDMPQHTAVQSRLR